MALISKEIRQTTESTIKATRYHELAADPDFNIEFINAIPIPNRVIANSLSKEIYLRSCMMPPYI